jgi:type II secretory pathway pseudopilin PulG
MKNKPGQILLITVMLLATVMTIVLSVSFKSSTDTQVTKLEEESQKALAAAESAIEVALKNNSTATLGSGSLNSISGFSGEATIATTTSNQFTTPTIVKDGSYTFYLGDYNLASKTIGNSINQSIDVCFNNGTTVEITLVKTTGVKKYFANGSVVGCPDKGVNIPAADISTDSKFLLVQVLYAPTKLLFSSSANLPAQGRTVTSEVKSSTSTGVSKKVVLFQSYPQIPGEFFTTAF